MWGTRVRAAGLLAFTWLVGSAASARADRILVLPPSGTRSLEREATRLTERLVATLGSTGHEARLAVGGEAELASSVLACDTHACASAGLMALDVDVVAAPALWARAPGRNELSLTAIGSRGTPLDLLRTLAAEDGPAAVAALVQDLVAHLDALAAPPEAAGSASAISDTPSARGGSALARPERARRSAVNTGLGLGLLVVGIAPLSIAGVSLARRGECVTPIEPGLCADDGAGRYTVYAFGPRSVAMLSAGIVSVGTGAFLLAARPIRIRPAVDTAGRPAGLAATLAF